MKTAVACLAAVGSAQAFMPVSITGTKLAVSTPSTATVTKMAVNDMLGADVETGGVWDPLGLGQDEEKLYQYRAAELKHGRVAMLAALGELVQEFTQLPDPVFSETKPLAALYKVYSERPAAIWQIIFFIGALEVAFAPQDPSKEPGDVGGQGWIRYKDQAVRNEGLTKELKNGRLAMVSIFGMWAQEALTGQGPLEQILAGHTNPFGDGQGFF